MADFAQGFEAGSRAVARRRHYQLDRERHELDKYERLRKIMQEEQWREEARGMAADLDEALRADRAQLADFLSVAFVEVNTGARGQGGEPGSVKIPAITPDRLAQLESTANVLTRQSMLAQAQTLNSFMARFAGNPMAESIIGKAWENRLMGMRDAMTSSARIYAEATQRAGGRERQESETEREELRQAGATTRTEMDIEARREVRSAEAEQARALAEKFRSTDPMAGERLKLYEMAGENVLLEMEDIEEEAKSSSRTPSEIRLQRVKDYVQAMGKAVGIDTGIPDEPEAALTAGQREIRELNQMIRAQRDLIKAVQSGKKFDPEHDFGSELMRGLAFGLAGAMGMLGPETDREKELERLRADLEDMERRRQALFERERREAVEKVREERRGSASAGR